MKLRKRKRHERLRQARLERLETRCLLAAQPIIAEFMADNENGLRDGDGRRSDWIEIRNAGDAPVDLAGWHLTDLATQLDRWTFPAAVSDTLLDPGESLLVFASGQPADSAARHAGVFVQQ